MTSALDAIAAIAERHAFRGRRAACPRCL
jgi:hypothetical protein